MRKPIHRRASHNENASRDAGLRLHSIEKMPRDLPIWELLITDLGHPPAGRIARALGVGASTVYRWNAAGKAPRMACLALFWLTRWGHSQVDADATNNAILSAQLARAWRDECNKLAARLPADLPWPVIEPATLPVPAESGLPLVLPGGGEVRLSLVGTETSPRPRVRARSNV